MEFLHNQKGILCTINKEKFIYMKYNNKPILIQFFNDANLISEISLSSSISSSKIFESLNLNGEYYCNFISYSKDSSSTFLRSFITPYFVWINGKPFHITDLEDGMKLSFDAIFLKELGFCAILLWQGFKPFVVPQLKFEELLLNEAYFKLPIHEVSFKDEKAYVHVTIDQEIKEVPFTFNNVYTSENKIILNKDIYKLLCTSTQLLASVGYLIPCKSHTTLIQNQFYCFCISQSNQLLKNENALKIGNIYSLRNETMFLETSLRPMIYYDVKFKQIWNNDYVEVMFFNSENKYSFKHCSLCNNSNIEEGIGHIYVYKENCFILVTKVVHLKKSLTLGSELKKCSCCQLNKVNIKSNSRQKENLEKEIPINDMTLSEMNNQYSSKDGYQESHKKIIATESKKDLNNPNSLFEEENAFNIKCLSLISKKLKTGNVQLLVNTKAFLSTNFSGEPILLFILPGKEETIYYKNISDINNIFCNTQWLNINENFFDWVYFDGLYDVVTGNVAVFFIWVNKKPFYANFREKKMFLNFVGIVKETSPLIFAASTKKSMNFKISNNLENKIFDTFGKPYKHLFKGATFRGVFEKNIKESEYNLIYAYLIDYKNDEATENILKSPDNQPLDHKWSQNIINNQKVLSLSRKDCSFSSLSEQNFPESFKKANKKPVLSLDIQNKILCPTKIMKPNSPQLDETKFIQNVANKVSLQNLNESSKETNTFKTTRFTSTPLKNSFTKKNDETTNNEAQSPNSTSTQLILSNKIVHSTPLPQLQISTTETVEKMSQTKMKNIHKQSLLYFTCHWVAEGLKCGLFQATKIMCIIKKNDICIQADKKKYEKNEPVYLLAIKLFKPIKFNSLTITHYGFAAWSGRKINQEDKINKKINVNLNFYNTFTKVQYSIQPLIQSDSEILMYINSLTEAGQSTCIAKAKKKYISKFMPLDPISNIQIASNIKTLSSVQSKKNKKKNALKKKKLASKKSKIFPSNSNLNMAKECYIKLENTSALTIYSDKKNISNAQHLPLNKTFGTIQGTDFLQKLDESKMPSFLCYFNHTFGSISKSGSIFHLPSSLTALLQSLKNPGTLECVEIYPCENQTFFNLSINSNSTLNISQEKKTLLCSLPMLSNPSFHLILDSYVLEEKKITNSTSFFNSSPSGNLSSSNMFALKKKHNLGIFYFVEGQITMFNNQEGFLCISNHIINKNESKPSLIYCYFNKKVAYMTADNNAQNYKILKNHIHNKLIFKAAVYHCERQLIMNMEINFCVSLLWNKIIPKNVSFVCILPPLHKNLYSQVKASMYKDATYIKNFTNISGKMQNHSNFKNDKTSNQKEQNSTPTFENSKHKLEETYFFEVEKINQNLGRLFYLVEGKITAFNETQGILKFKSNFINIAESKVPSRVCFFDINVASFRKKKEPILGDASDYIKVNINCCVFQAVIYQCRQQIIMNTEVNFCAALLWKNYLPKNIILKQTLPPLILDPCLEMTHILSGNIHHNENSEIHQAIQDDLLMKTEEKITIANLLNSVKFKPNEGSQNKMYYFVEGRITDFVSNEGILAVPSHFFDIFKGKSALSVVYCYFNKSIVYSQNQMGLPIIDMNSFIHQIRSQNLFKAIVYTCEKKFFLEKEISYCSLILWKQTFPSNIELKHILPPLNYDASKSIQIFPKRENNEVSSTNLIKREKSVLSDLADSTELKNIETLKVKDLEAVGHDSFISPVPSEKEVK